MGTKQIIEKVDKSLVDIGARAVWLDHNHKGDLELRIVFPLDLPEQMLADYIAEASGECFEVKFRKVPQRHEQVGCQSRLLLLPPFERVMAPADIMSEVALHITNGSWRRKNFEKVFKPYKYTPGERVLCRRSGDYLDKVYYFVGSARVPGSSMFVVINEKRKLVAFPAIAKCMPEGLPVHLRDASIARKWM